jgi:hypothetical protein
MEAFVQQKQVFLIQCNGEMAYHKYSKELSDRTYSDEVNKYFYYRNDTWNTTDKRDKDFGEIKLHDIIIQYCTRNVANCPSQIKNIYNVIKIESIDEDRTYPHIIRLKLDRSLNRGCELSTIQQLVAQGRLSIKMKNCGQRGFNICQVGLEDYQELLSWDNE